MIKIPGHDRRASRHPATRQRGDQRQRDACSLLRKLTSVWRKRIIAGLEKVAACGGRSARRWRAWPAFLSAGSIAPMDALMRRDCGKRRKRASKVYCAGLPARWRSPTTSSPTGATRNSSAERAGRRWTIEARKRSVCYGRARARRILTNATWLRRRADRTGYGKHDSSATFEAFRDMGGRAQASRKMSMYAYDTMADARRSRNFHERRD